jgi:tripartite-type tricarboxylate transporter receptor subunit TctC
MIRFNKGWVNTLTCFSVLLAFAFTARAQQAPASWPSGPVRFVVPFPAGSAPDVLIRFVGVKLTEKWNQPVVVDNRPGGSGVIGMNAILTAPADGSVFGFVQGSAISVAPSIIKDVKYEFKRDFVPVTLPIPRTRLWPIW